MFKFLAACFGSALLFSVSCLANDTSAEITPFLHLDNTPGVLVLNGDIDLRTPLAFKRALQKYPDTRIVALSSNGGSVQSALLIAEDVYEKRLTTLIPKDVVCASACALIFFAGSSRLAEGKLGVHQISGSSNVSDAQLNISDILDVLGKYDVPQAVITKMFRTRSEDIYFFTPEEVVSLGINRSGSRPAPKSAIQPEQTSVPTDDESLKAKALSFVISLVNSGNDSKEKALSIAASSYTDVVSFFGHEKAKSEVLDEKLRYIERWPLRQALIDPQTIQTRCVSGVCTVTGVYAWQVANPDNGKRLMGTAEFEYRLNMLGDPRVMAEGGKVLSRNRVSGN